MRGEIRTRSRLLRAGLLVAVAGQVLWSFRPTSTAALTEQELEGRALYEANCSTCHGLQGEGTENGPTLQGVGPAAVDFMLGTGRMPLGNPGDQPVRQSPAFTPEQIRAITAYVGTIAPGGPEVATVDPGSGSISAGMQLFLNNCSACHGAAAVGDSVGGGQIAPSLEHATPTQIVEAIRIGPGVMPRFDPNDLSEDDVASVARYLLWLRNHGSFGGLQLGRIGAVSEGFVAIVIGLGLLFLVIRLTGSKW